VTVKLGLVFGSVVFLIAGITLASNSSEVMGQSDLEKAKDIISTAANTTANATREVITRAENVLNLTSDAASNATSQSQAGLQKYGNPVMGIKFDYPTNWSSISSISNETLNSMTNADRLSHNLNLAMNKEENCSESNSIALRCFIEWSNYDGIAGEAYSKNYTWDFAVASIPQGDPQISKNCVCDTLVEYMRYQYRLLNALNANAQSEFTYIGDNQTTVGEKYPGWQLEFSEQSPNGDYSKKLQVYTKVNNTFYQISFFTASNETYSKHLPEIENVLDSMNFFQPKKEIIKAPSFITPEEAEDINRERKDAQVNENDFQSILSNEFETVNESDVSEELTSDGGIQVLSHNSFIDSIGAMHIVGEAINKSPSTAEFVKITGTFYDTNNQVVATDFTYTNPSDIGSGQKAPFELLLMSASIPVSQIHHYNIQASYQ
jgi:hypothetical protein